MAPPTKIKSSSAPDVSLDHPEENIGTSPVKVTIEDREYTIGNFLFRGDFCDLYSCTFSAPVEAHHGTWYDRLLDDDDGPITRGVVKIVRVASDNDLAENEVKILTKIYPPREKDEKFYRYLPRLLDSCALPRSGRRINIFPFLEGYIPLVEVIGAYPTGIDFRDMAWMLKRLLVAIGFAHKNGVVHGAVLPTHVMVHPTAHGAKLIDWSFAVEAGDHIHGACGAYEAYYPPEIFEKVRALPATDIYMTAKSIVALLGGDPKTNQMPATVPAEVKAFLEACLIRNPTRRPQDAWELHEEFDKVLQKLVGKPKYRPFKMPEKN